MHNKMMTVVLFTACCCFGNASAGEWTTLFDGKTLNGWENPYEWGEASVVDGEIHLVADRKFFLCTAKEYADFIVEADVKMPGGEGNSGFMIRAKKERNKVSGYQAEVDTQARAWSGGLYGEASGGWKYQPRKPDNSPSGDAFRLAAKGSFDKLEWNTYKIHCVGPRIRVYVNGVLATDYYDDGAAKGYLALQHHGENGKVYRFRNIRIKELDDAKPLAIKVLLDESFEEATLVDMFEMTDPNAWEIKKVETATVLNLKGVSKYTPPVRSPLSIAWFKDIEAGSFCMDAIVKSTDEKGGGHQDLCFFFGGRDASHFYYTHIAAKADPHAHAVMLVNGAPRRSITTYCNQGIQWGKEWHRIRIRRECETGLTDVFFDDLETPVMTAEDTTFGKGRIGIGSFDNTGYFDWIRIVSLD